MPRIELLARLDLVRRFGERAAHAGRLTELRARYPDLNALAVDDTADDNGTAQNLQDDLPARHRGFMGR
jgi:hypothetical protein